MPTTAQKILYPPPSPQRSPESPGDHPNSGLFQILTDTRLSTEARCLGATMISMSWNRGYCWPSITTQADYLDRSVSSVFRYHQELEAHGYVTIDRSGSSCNRYFPTALSPQGSKGDGVRPRSGRGTRTSTGNRGEVSPVEGGGVTGATLTPVRTTYENVKNVPAEPPRRPEWLDNYWSHLDQENVENVDKIWPQKEEVPDTAKPNESQVAAPDPNVQVEGNAITACNNLVTSTAPDSNTPGNPGGEVPDPEKVQYSSADSGDQVRDDHLPRVKNISTPNPDKAQYSSANSADRGDRAEHGDQVNSPVRVRRPKSQKVFDAGLLQEILDLTGDRKSLGCWISCVSRLPEEEIRIGLSSLRIAMAESDVYKPGAYLLGVIRSRNPDFSFSGKGKKKHHGRNHDDHVISTEAPPRITRTPDHVRAPLVLPSPPEPAPPSIEDQIRGWRFAAGSIGVPRMLEIMKTSIGNVLDPSALWSQVRDLCSGLDERTTVDRFLQVITTRLKHALGTKAETPCAIT